MSEPSDASSPQSTLSVELSTPDFAEWSKPESADHMTSEVDDTDNKSGGTASTAQGFQNLVKAFIGAGMLSMPSAFAAGGVIQTLLMLVLMAAISRYCVVLLLKSAYALRDKARRNGDPNWRQVANTFSSIAEFTYGRWCFWLTRFGLMSAQIGACTAYLSFIALQLADVVPSVSRVSWVVILSFALCVLMQLRSANSLAWASLLGNFVYGTAVVIVLSFGFHRNEYVSWDDSKLFDFGGFPYVFGTMCFALEGIGLILPVERSLRDRSKIGVVVDRTYGFAASLFAFFGLVCYLFWGKCTTSPVLSDLPDHTLAHIVKLTIAFVLVLSYVLQMFPVTAIVQKSIVKWIRSRRTAQGGAASGDLGMSLMAGQERDQETADVSDLIQNHKSKVLQEFLDSLSRCVLVWFTGIFAIILGHNFGLVVSLVGSVALSLIGFILPCLFYLFVCRPETGHTWQSAWKPVTVIVIGVLGSIVGVVTAIIDFAEGDHKPC